jgi:hypothetical protein
MCHSSQQSNNRLCTSVKHSFIHFLWWILFNFTYVPQNIYLYNNVDVCTFCELKHLQMMLHLDTHFLLMNSNLMGMKTQTNKKVDTKYKTQFKGLGNVHLNHVIRTAHSPYKLRFTYHLLILLYVIIIYKKTNSHKLIQVAMLLTCTQETSSLNLS